MKPEWQWMKIFNRQPKRTKEENLAIHDKIVAARKALAEKKAKTVIKELTGEDFD